MSSKFPTEIFNLFARSQQAVLPLSLKDHLSKIQLILFPDCKILQDETVLFRFRLYKLYYLTLSWVAAEKTNWDKANKDQRFLILELIDYEQAKLKLMT